MSVKIRKPRAKPQVKHKSKKDYNRLESKVKSFECYKCKCQFFGYDNLEGKLPTCIECWDWKGENP